MNETKGTIRLRNPIPLPLEDLVPAPDLFAHRSDLHGQQHVSRVMVHAFVLLDAVGCREEAPRLWAAVYLHDLARLHDGVAYEHGADAVQRLSEFEALFARGGVAAADHEAIRVAVTHHSLSDELPRDHRHWRLTALLKDADGLDRVRLGDLDPQRLRFAETPRLVPFSEQLLWQTEGRRPPGPGYFPWLWAQAQTLLESVQSA